MIGECSKKHRVKEKEVKKVVKMEVQIIEVLSILGTVICEHILACYMNSFLQCLYMTKEYRRKVLDVSTLAV